MSELTLMAREISEIPAITERQITEAFPAYRAEGRRLKELDPDFFMTCARGTSDQAALYFKYLIELRAGIPVASIGPSLGSIYKARLRMTGAACLSISQSGGSPDLSALQKQAKEGGARTLAILNVEDSSLGLGADRVLPLLAGPEIAVAATKSYVASLVAVAALVAEFADDKELAGQSCVFRRYYLKH